MILIKKGKVRAIGTVEGIKSEICECIVAYSHMRGKSIEDAILEVANEVLRSEREDGNKAPVQ